MGLSGGKKPVSRRAQSRQWPVPRTPDGKAVNVKYRQPDQFAFDERRLILLRKS
jgi:hypothetical protein